MADLDDLARNLRKARQPPDPPKERCYRCGAEEGAFIHRKDYGGGQYTRHHDGYRTETIEPYHGPTTHPYVPGLLTRG